MFMAAGVLLYDAGVKRGIRIPTYSVVSLVEGPAKTLKPSSVMPSSLAGEVKTSAPDRPAVEVEKKKTVKVKGKGKASDAAVSEAIKKIALKVRKKERKAVVAEGIEALRKKREAQAQRPAGTNGAQDGKGMGRPEARSSGGPRSNAGTGIGAKGASSQEGFKEQYPAYYSLIRDRVQSRWIYPEEFKERRILVTVSIRIGKDGGLMETRLEGSSGNELFDESLISAVKKSAPFPPLPHGFEADYLEAILRFCSSCGD